MALRIYVDAYSGYKANERPRQFQVDEELFEIAEVEDRWCEPTADYFRVRTTEPAPPAGMFLRVIATVLDVLQRSPNLRRRFIGLSVSSFRVSY